ncbi:DNA-binding transcriptional regulator, CsgD family [Jatrophihabitans endophyticus]|uniref:DNA-binding transcriptional regulator, CsgD family n=1 Tax=Jatrophihabitans endophyticus TaxID=1206085 RepID=A0A1M5KN33_9ACTN|nr:helix-turn-helix transcriptional regulator [Jatrophihabitans endophyticus]SHG54110.1 DNA-binding transcriptional regulator, CsgD family [Jatrophihabitans endophyticus]
MATVRTRTLAERLGTATASCPDVESLSRAVFGAVRRHVPFVFACLATTDPASELITAAYKSHPLPMGDEDFAAAEYGRPDVNQLAEIARRPVPVGVLSIDTGGEVGRCRRLRDYMTPAFGFTDELRLVCRARGAVWGALALYRGEGGPPFTTREADELAGVHELLADGVRRTLFAPPAAHAAPTCGAAVLVVDDTDRVTDMTATVPRQIDDLGGWDHGSLPANVLSVVALARASREPARTRVLGRHGRWLALHAMPLDGGSGARSVVVTVDVAAPAAVGELALAARGLTAREQDVARLVLQGASTKVIAASLHLSPHTVQDHLKAVFDKLGVSSRRELIAQLVLA